MTTSIVFTHTGKIPVPGVSSVHVAQGDTFELSVADEGKAVLYFSPALAAILSPVPGSSVTVSAGSSATFTFQSSAPGAYFIVAAQESAPAPTHFRTVPSSHVAIEATFALGDMAFPVSGGRTESNN